MATIVAMNDPPPRACAGSCARRSCRCRVDEAFAFFADPLNLEAITPPWLRFRVLTRPSVLEAGALIDYRLSLHRVPVSWRTRIEEWEPGGASSTASSAARSTAGSTCTRSSRSTAARSSPTASTTACRSGRSAALAHALLVGRDLDRIFDFRREAVARLLGQPAR